VQGSPRNKGGRSPVSRRSTSVFPTPWPWQTTTWSKNGIREMASQAGCSVTFMAKPDHRWIGPLPLREPVEGLAQRLRRRVGRVQALPCRPHRVRLGRRSSRSTSTLTSATPPGRRRPRLGPTTGLRLPHRRPQPAPCAPSRVLAPTSIRTCALPLSWPPGCRIEEAQAAPEFKGNAYESDVQRFPSSLRRRSATWRRDVPAAFGDDVIDATSITPAPSSPVRQGRHHYERERLFERG
jgi:hypothetical protein